jgi:uncharacterized protein involved in exopolysaccharide biosynthesis
MTTHPLIAPFWKRRWLILTTTLAVIGSTLLWAQGLPHVYESSVVLAANSADAEAIPPGQIPRLHQELWSAAVIDPVIQSERFKDQRTAGASTEVLVERLRKSTSLIEDRQGDSVVVRLYYRDRNPEASEAIVNLLGQAIDSAELRNGSDKANSFRIVQSASKAVGPIKPRLFILAFYAFGGGLLAGLLLAGISELLNFRRHEKLGSPSMRAT